VAYETIHLYAERAGRDLKPGDEITAVSRTFVDVRRKVTHYKAVVTFAMKFREREYTGTMDAVMAWLKATDMCEFIRTITITMVDDD